MSTRLTRRDWATWALGFGLGFGLAYLLKTDTRHSPTNSNHGINSKWMTSAETESGAARDSWLSQHLQRKADSTNEDSAASAASADAEMGARLLEDWALRGEYFLQLENPSAQSLLRNNWSNHVARMAQQRREDGIRDVLQRVGLRPEQVDQLERHLSKIDLAVLQAEAHSTQLHLAKDDYDKRLRSVLSEGDYGTYRAFEEQGQARKEVQRLRAHLLDSGLALEDEFSSRLIPKIAGSGAYTGNYWPGPFDKVKEVRFGYESVIQSGQEQLESMRQGWLTLEASMDAEIRASEWWKGIEQYYQKRIADRETRNQRIQRSGELHQQLGPGGFVDAIRNGSISP